MVFRAAAMAALVAGAAHAAAFGIALESSKIALSNGALKLGFVVSPAQPGVSEVTIDTLVDTTGKAVLSNLVRLVLCVVSTKQVARLRLKQRAHTTLIE